MTPECVGIISNWANRATLERFHRRCAEYHAAREQELMAAQNYRDAGHHEVLRHVHRHAADFLARLDAGAPSRAMNHDERDDTAIGR